MTAYVWRVAIGFTVGGIVGFLGMIVPSMVVVFLGNLIPLIRPLIRPLFLMGPLVGFLISGTIGGAALKISRKVVIGFSIGFLVPGLVVPFMLIGIQRGSGNPSFVGLLSFALIFGLVFGLAGTIGAAFMGQGFRIIRAGAVGFGVGGVIGGAVAWLPELPEFNMMLLEAGNIVGLLIPYFIGGTILGAAAEKAAAQSNLF